MFVPVIGQDQQPLMPTTPARARKWINSGPVAREVQPIAVGIDPGSKREGYSVVSAAHTYVNIQAEARQGVKEAERGSSRMRRTRRKRKTPCRQPRSNRHQSKQKLPPSTRARGPWKLRLARFLCQLFPVSVFVVEDIKAPTAGKKRWDQSFSPLEVGKRWFYAELGQLATVQPKQGYETKALRDQLGLKKTGKKLAEIWEAHCVDSWVLASSAVEGGKRKPYGGTLSQGIKRGTLVKHPKRGKATVGGTMDGKLSLHHPETNRRLTQTACVADCTLITLLRWRTRLVPLAHIPASPAPKRERLLPPVAQAVGYPQAGDS